MLQAIFDKLSPPKFLDVPFSALVFSDASIKCLHWDDLGRKPLFFKEVGLAPGTIESGQIKNADNLTQTLREIREILPTPFVKFAIPDETAYVFSARVPVMPGKRADESVAFVLEENVPLALSEVNFDFVPLGVEQTANGFFSQVVATAAASALVDSYVAVLRGASLEPLLCVNESQAMARSIIPAEYKGISIIAYIHKGNVGIYAAKGQVIEFSSITKTTDKNYLQTVVSELTNTHKYLEEHKSGEETETKYFLCGRYEECEEAAGEVNRLEGVKASIASVWVNLFDVNEYVPDLSFEDSLKYASAIGLLI
jgi:hypothetical protein